MKCTSMKHILALLSWGQICILKEPEAFTFAKMEVGHPVLLQPGNFLGQFLRNFDTFEVSMHGDLCMVSDMHVSKM